MSDVKKTDNPVRVDLAILNDTKGVLKLTDEGLIYTPRKGNQIRVPIENIDHLSYKKTAMTTSTLYINDMQITVCRAHLWAADIKRLKDKNGVKS
ncbi:MAG: hypothetical protein B2I18_05910 [Cuniculiplasma sp. C_DKE]|jgi:hypothetical protein|nr:MAG: hypothetical protein B2I18_05910 [Cuniculiplasma sp. C_DKE]